MIKTTDGSHKDYAYVVGDFNEWTLANDETSQMYRDETTGCWWITISDLDPAKEYRFQYYVGTLTGDVMRLADPYSEKILDRITINILQHLLIRLQKGNILIKA